MKKIEKVLSRNDVGETGAHQAGFLIPKHPREIREFFPALDPSARNPRVPFDVIDEEGVTWTFQYIYYNGKMTGTSTRNEYRLTGMTPFFRHFSLKAGDTIILTQDGRYVRITYRRKEVSYIDQSTGRETIKLSGAWTVVELDETNE
jgi:hypothetical protein